MWPCATVESAAQLRGTFPASRTRPMPKIAPLATLADQPHGWHAACADGTQREEAAMTRAADTTRREIAAERATIAQTRQEAGAPEGLEPAAPDDTEETGATFLGADEPTVDRDKQGERPAPQEHAPDG